MTSRASTIVLEPTFMRAGALVLIWPLVVLPVRINAGLPPEPTVIPEPLHLEVRDGRFLLEESTRIVMIGDTAALHSTAELLASPLRTVTGFPFEVVAESETAGKNIVLSVSNNEKAAESYRLTVTPGRVMIESGSQAGLFYGVETFLQLLPPEVQAGRKTTGIEWSAQSVVIEDRPRFRWRGIHLDVCRHFFSKEFVKKYIDLIAAYKMNVFHWHLTDDQGWRIRIGKYPRLTTTGAWRRETMGDCLPHGGFYTQEDIREVVEYAGRRFVTVVPEIEMPGHSLAALASYPELSCSGGPFDVWTEWGVTNDVYCAGREETFRFLEDVIDEVSRLFPGPFFLIGGDECPKIRWANCVRCQERIRSEHLKNEDELQSYFIRRIERLLAVRGKRLIGWDEILEGGLAPNATVMSWRGTEGGIAAAVAGHDVVMSPGSHCYFDHYQGLVDEPKAIGGFLPIDTVYAFEPVPPGLSPEQAGHILGAQANMWSEWIPDSLQVEFMLLPRMLAMSEVVWTKKELRNYADFAGRLREHFVRLRMRTVNFRVPPPVGAGGRAVIFADTSITLQAPLARSRVFYCFDDGTSPADTLLLSGQIRIGKTGALRAWTILDEGSRSIMVSSVFQKVDRELNGLRYRYYEGDWEKLPDFGTLKPSATGRAYDVNLTGIPHVRERFAIVLSGYLTTDRADSCTFFLSSDDGSRLLIDGRVVVDNDGLHPMTEAGGAMALVGGRHTFEVQFFQRTGVAGLGLMIQRAHGVKQWLPAEWLTPE